MVNIKEINMKNKTYYSFDDMINIKNFDTSLRKIDKKTFITLHISQWKILNTRIFLV